MDGSRSHYYFINLSTQLDAQFSIQCLQGVAVLIASLADENDYDAADREKVDVDADVSCLCFVCLSVAVSVAGFSLRSTIGGWMDEKT